MCVTDVEDYAGGLNTITIPAGLMYKQFTINITDDNIVECSETFNVAIGSVNGSRVTVASTNHTEVLIVDNDSKCE